MGYYRQLARIAEVEFSSIVAGTEDFGHKLRIYLKDKSFIDFFLSRQAKILRFSLHWERRHLDNTFHRIDNTPDSSWRKIKTFPVHYHRRSYKEVREVPFRFRTSQELLRKFLRFVQTYL